MQKCPKCAEYLNDDLTQCPYCGERFAEPKPVLGQTQAQPGGKAPAAKNEFWLPLSGLFVLLSIVASILAVSLNQKNDFPLIPSALAILGAFGIILSLTLTRKGSTRRYPLMAFFLPALIIGAYGFSKGMTSYNDYRREQSLIQEKLLKEEAARQKELNDILEHREELYQEGLTFFNDKKYTEAKEKLARVLVPDKDYKDAPALLAQTEEILSRMDRERQTAEAKDKLDKAEKLLKSESCREYQQAIQYAKEAEAILIGDKKADRILLDAELQELACFKGNDQVQMAVQVQGYKPLKLYVWIKNLSTGYREANPGYFSLVTVTGRSYRVSSKTYDLKKFLDALILNPGAETSGIILFDTYDNPKKLTYSETFPLGTTISREFPFNQ